MKYVVYGAGAVGGVIGGHLHLAGLDVTLVARGAHLAAIRSAGLRARHRRRAPPHRRAGHRHRRGPRLDRRHRGGPRREVPPGRRRPGRPPRARARGRPPSSARPTASPPRPQRCALFARIYAVCVMLPATHLEPGRGRGRVPPDPRRSSTSAASPAAPTRPLPRSRPTSRPPASSPWSATTSWRGSAASSCSTSATASTPPSPRATPPTSWPSGPWPRASGCSPPPACPLVTAEEDRERRGSILQRRTDLERRGGSTWQSLARGTGDSEIDYLAGEIVLQGRLHGVADPGLRGRSSPRPAPWRRRGGAPAASTPPRCCAPL